MKNVPERWRFLYHLKRAVHLRVEGDCLREVMTSADVYLPPITLQNLGDPQFLQDMGIRYPYLSGAMANGISSSDLVIAMGRAGMLGFFGAAGLDIAAIEDAILTLKTSNASGKFGCNLIHSPFARKLEEQTVDLYLRHGIDMIEASAFMDITLPLVKYRTAGLYLDAKQEIVVPNKITAKVSREELVTKFFSPPPPRFLQVLCEQGVINEKQAQLAAHIPMADNITAEADSGGHTDNRALISMLPTFIRIRDRLALRYRHRLYVGAAGGIADPCSALAAFSMGAAYVVTGSINQACVEARTSDAVKKMLAAAGQADITMAPAADMFELGIKVQVLKKGTMFAQRAHKLYRLYTTHAGLADLAAEDRHDLEKNLFQQALASAWQETEDYFASRDPHQITRAERDPKHKMALLFRSYLGKASIWANQGVATRQLDFQIWCGAAMGAFNAWVKDSFLEQLDQCRVADVGMNILFGAALLTRWRMLKMQTTVSLFDFNPRPLPLATIKELA